MVKGRHPLSDPSLIPQGSPTVQRRRLVALGLLQLLELRSKLQLLHELRSKLQLLHELLLVARRKHGLDGKPKLDVLDWKKPSFGSKRRLYNVVDREKLIIG